MTDRLHGEWNETGTRRWCADCGIWVRLEDWQDHKREEAKLVADGGREQRDDLERIADALELQNALLLQLVQDRERERVQEHPDPDHTGRSDHAIATDVVDAYGDLYGGSVGGWEFDPVSDQVENMGDSQ